MAETGPVLNQINVVVKDMDATVAFYERLGVKVERGPGAWRHHHVTAQMPNGFRLEFDSQTFAPMWDAGWRPTSGNPCILAFELSGRDVVDRLYADLTGDGYVGRQTPYDAFWGSRFAIVEDPDGNGVALMSPMEADRATPPPDI